MLVRSSICIHGHLAFSTFFKNTSMLINAMIDNHTLTFIDMTRASAHPSLPHYQSGRELSPLERYTTGTWSFSNHDISALVALPELRDDTCALIVSSWYRTLNLSLGYCVWQANSPPGTVAIGWTVGLSLGKFGRVTRSLPTNGRKVFSTIQSCEVHVCHSINNIILDEIIMMIISLLIMIHG